MSRELPVGIRSLGVAGDVRAAITHDAMTGMAQPAGGFLAGVAPDHAAALLAPLLLPLAVWAFIQVVDFAARANLASGRRFQRGFDGASPLARVTGLLLALAGVIHLALVPGHLAVDGGLAILFALNGVAFVGVAIAVFVARRWRPAAATLLVMTLAAYLYYLGTGREDPDLIGALTYLVELVALGLVWIPRDRAREGATADRDRGPGVAERI